MDQQYEMLSKGDTIQEGDEYLNPDAGWCLRGGGFGVALGPKHFPHRRPIPMNDPNYRILKEGEVLEKGDEVRISGLWQPYPVSKYPSGHTVMDKGSSCRPQGYYRRPIKNRPEGLPEGVPDPPVPPEGKVWAYRGMGWHVSVRNERPPFDYAWWHSGEWHVNPHDTWTCGTKNCHYLEAVPIEPTPEVWTFRSEEPVWSWGLSAEVEDLRDEIGKLEHKLVVQDQTANEYAQRALAAETKLETLRKLLQ